jgi:peptide/nickel transport system permease protein
MWKTILRRFLVMIPQLFVLSLLIFIMAKFMPGDPFTGAISPETDPSRIEELREIHGLNDPWYQQYVRWLGNAVQGEFGTSYTFQQPVANLIGDRALNTFWLSLLTTVFLYLIAIPLGVLAGRYQNSLFDRAVVLYSFVTYAIPLFVLALIFIYFFAFQLGWFPAMGSEDIRVETGSLAWYWSKLYHMLLPAITSAILGTTTVIQFLRSEVIDAKAMDYVRTARSKGVPSSKVYTRHILRNSLLPIAAFFGFTITSLLGGSIFIETIFGYPGMGKLFIQAIGSRDYSIITALVLLYGFLTLLGSLLSDIIMTIVDPRIRIE